LENNNLTPSRYDKLSLWLLIYASSYAFFHIFPVFLNYEIKNRFMVADVFDMLTPFVLVFLIYKIYCILLTQMRENSNTVVQSGAVIILIAGAIAFVEGHGMHLSANAIARHLIPAKDSPLYALDYFFDEILGHILWDGGTVLLSIGLLIMAFDSDEDKLSNPKPLLFLFASLLYGFTYFVNGIEGQTVVFTFPLALLAPLFVLWLVRRHHRQFWRNPVISFYSFAYILAFCLFVFWGIWHKGFPQFSELGWI
jgi:hypothetical protein